MSTGIDAISQRLQRVAAEARLPEVEVSSHYGTPALKVGGKAFVSIKNDETIVLALPIDRKEQLIEMAPEIYFQSDHYVGWPSLPTRIAAIGDDELKFRLIEAWQFRASKKLRVAFDAG
ncbi:MmcQ/YjbR family DNA-binding protein [Rhizobium mayense]|uniref:MmcQ/YjbR family DNA-binding protein n=1 Tax=Rhizobium mayense TaxID=1312184 RepID=A0ABT7K0U3_9HYPH|nr:MmcQ/YjbR family DNA-binding protein [Rhizobium mayense]MDL2402224.1 MmcQ/YjbR family DNA-binding protein [Rhizobium mayense]